MLTTGHVVRSMLLSVLSRPAITICPSVFVRIYVKQKVSKRRRCFIGPLVPSSRRAFPDFFPTMIAVVVNV